MGGEVLRWDRPFRKRNIGGLVKGKKTKVRTRTKKERISPVMKSKKGKSLNPQRARHFETIKLRNILAKARRSAAALRISEVPERSGVLAHAERWGGRRFHVEGDAWMWFRQCRPASQKGSVVGRKAGGTVWGAGPCSVGPMPRKKGPHTGPRRFGRGGCFT